MLRTYQDWMAAAQPKWGFAVVVQWPSFFQIANAYITSEELGLGYSWSEYLALMDAFLSNDKHDQDGKQYQALGATSHKVPQFLQVLFLVSALNAFTASLI